MDVTLYDSLEEKISEWIEESCESAYWPDFYVSDDTHKFMARVAAAVFDSIIEVQNFLIHEELMERT